MLRTQVVLEEMSTAPSDLTLDGLIHRFTTASVAFQLA